MDQTDGKTAVVDAIPSRRASDIAQCGPRTIAKDKSVYEAVSVMVSEHISGLPVVDQGRLVGIVTEKDLLRLLHAAEFIPGKVEEFMTTDPITFEEDCSLADVCECLANNPFRRVPIMHQGKLTGIISRSDIIKACKDKFKPENQADQSADRRRRPTAEDVMKRGLLTVRRQTPIYDAMNILATEAITGLPVVDDAMNLVGILTEKDMLKSLRDPYVKAGNAEDFMTENVTSFRSNDSLYDICDCLIENSFRRVPILDAGKVVGIISRADVMIYILKNKSAFFGRRREDRLR
ncbi:MAG: CBS domain-containing protein [Sedimentisphaerales bacterium]|nr:CBS domain-containing protein [Sedimentisphaerales bacterium]